MRYMQAPITQFWLAAHAVPHMPQLASSICVLTQSAPQSVKLPGQAHIEALQIWPFGQAVVQLPQCAGLFSVFTQSGGLPQALLLAGQTQTPPAQM